MGKLFFPWVDGLQSVKRVVFSRGELMSHKTGEENLLSMKDGLRGFLGERRFTSRVGKNNLSLLFWPGEGFGLP